MLMRFRVSLRTLLALTTLLCVVGGLAFLRFKAERNAEEQLVADGLAISFDPWGNRGRYWYNDPEIEQENASETLLGRLDWGLLRHVRCVDGQRSATEADTASTVDDNSLRSLESLRHVEILYLGFQPITDLGLESLRHLHSLKHLNLCGTKISDDGLANITNLDALEYLALEFTIITDSGLKHLDGFQDGCSRAGSSDPDGISAGLLLEKNGVRVPMRVFG